MATRSSPISTSRPKPTILHAYARLVVLATAALIAAGGLVTSTDSGLSVPDWPLSYGGLNPPMVGGIRFEHTHRLIAMAVGLLTIVLAVWLFRSEKRPWMKRLGAAAVGLVVLQGVLGGLTVIFLLPMPVSVLHACTGQIFFALVAAVAYFTSREWHLAPRIASYDAENLKLFARAFFGLLLFQLLLGAWTRHGGPAIMFHVFMGFVVLLASGAIATRVAGENATRPFLIHGVSLMLLAALEVALGFLSFLVLRNAGEMATPIQVYFPTLHQTFGAVLLAGGALLMLRFERILE